MKTIWILALLLIVSFCSLQFTSKDDFIMQPEVSAVDIQKGDVATVKMKIVKSNGFQKSNCRLATTSALPKGLKVSFDPASGLLDSTNISFSASDETPAGQYQVVLSCTMQRKTKGVIVKLNIR